MGHMPDLRALLQGPEPAVARDDAIPFNRPFIAGRELYYIAQAVLQGSIAGNSQFTKRCERWLEQRLATPRALLTHSCTAALEMAALLTDVGPGDEVIVPSFTFVTSASAFVLRGATPVFVDIDPVTLNIDPELVGQAVTPRTKVVVAVHYAGSPCDMTRIMETAGDRGLIVVEDAAQALLSRHGSRSLGTIGHLGCLSFHETKNVICGEGGALLVNDPRFGERAEMIREKGTNRMQYFQGKVDKYTWVELGSSFLPSDIVAAFLYGQFENADAIIARRRAIAERYRDGLAGLAESGYVELSHLAGRGDDNGHIFHIRTRNRAERTGLSSYLQQAGINAVFHYVPLHSSPAGRRYGRVHGALPVTDRVADTLLRLPLFYGMSDDDVDRVCACIARFYR